MRFHNAEHVCTVISKCRLLVHLYQKINPDDNIILKEITYLAAS